MKGISTYTLLDLARSVIGMIGFVALLGFPGYVVGWATDLAGFRERPIRERLLWAVPLSLSVVTYFMVVISKYSSFGTGCYSLLAVSVFGIGLLVEHLWNGRSAYKEGDLPAKAVVGISGYVLIWTLIVAVQLVDIGWGEKLYMSATVYDHSVRTAFIEAVVRSGVPPHNPLYCSASSADAGLACHAAPMRYYYFWYVLCGMVMKLTGISSREALIASCAWSGLALFCLIGLYARHFIGGDERAARRRTWAGIALLGVTGLDVLATGYNLFKWNVLPADMEWWSLTQVTSWGDTILWVPHHLAALICCLFAFLLVWISPGLRRSQQILCAIVGGAGFASSFGLSIYVAAAFAMALIPWTLWLCVVKRSDWQRLRVVACAGAIAIVLLMPYLSELKRDGPNIEGPAGEGKTHVLAIGIREIIPDDRIASFVGVKYWRDRYPGPVVVVMHLLAVFIAYPVEFGFYGLVLILFLWKARSAENLSEAQKHALFFAVEGLFICTFIRSEVIHTNDFGIRASLIPQFFLLLLAMSMGRELWVSLPRVVQGVARVMLFLGVLGTVYQVLLLRVAYPLAASAKTSRLANLPAETMAMRETGDVLDSKLPGNSVVQFNLDVPDFPFMSAHVLNTPRQLVNGDLECEFVFGGDPGPCADMLRNLGLLYLNPKYLAERKTIDRKFEANSETAYRICEHLGIDYLVVTRWDKVWNERNAWPWTLPIVDAKPNARVLACRRETMQ